MKWRWKLLRRFDCFFGRGGRENSLGHYPRPHNDKRGNIFHKMLRRHMSQA